MAQTTFTVASSNPSNEGKTHVWKLQVHTKATIFGITKDIKRTYYIGGMPVEAVVGTELKEDMAKFNIEARPFTIEETGETVMLNWLHVKPAA